MIMGRCDVGSLRHKCFRSEETSAVRSRLSDKIEWWFASLRCKCSEWALMRSRYDKTDSAPALSRLVDRAMGLRLFGVLVARED